MKRTGAAERRAVLRLIDGKSALGAKAAMLGIAATQRIRKQHQAGRKKTRDIKKKGAPCSGIPQTQTHVTTT